MAFNTSPSSGAWWHLQMLTRPYSPLPSCDPQTLIALHLYQRNRPRECPTSVLNTQSASSAQWSCRGKFCWALRLLPWICWDALTPCPLLTELATSIQLAMAPPPSSYHCLELQPEGRTQTKGKKQPLSLLISLHSREVKSRGGGGIKITMLWVSLHLSLNTYRLNSSGESSGPCFGLIR